ncbi:MAG: DNA starvation/stationary phase protection protein [Chlamydiia bacterium]|nr:DNA starvation/stationary phase protection protein [Chlamydiia bacterium]
MTPALEPNICQTMAKDLSVFLASSYALFLKTQNFHWNVKDPRFNELHALFEAEYRELLEQTDEIAERIRMLGQPSPGTFDAFKSLSFIDSPPEHLSGDEMIRHLGLDHQEISKWLTEAIKRAQECGDEGTADLYIQQMRAHDKQAWMLFSHLHERG